MGNSSNVVVDMAYRYGSASAITVQGMRPAYVSVKILSINYVYWV